MSVMGIDFDGVRLTAASASTGLGPSILTARPDGTSPLDLQALLEELRVAVSITTGTAVTNAVIAVAPCLSTRQRQTLRDSARRAGLEVGDIVEAPAAAIVGCGLGEAIGRGNRIVTYRLGATFSGTLVSVGDTTNGRPELHVLRSVCHEGLGAPASGDAEGRALRHDMPIDQPRTEPIAPQTLDATIELVMSLLMEWRLTPADVDQVILIGEHAALPYVRERVVSLFGAERAQQTTKPSECVSIGAALLAQAMPATGPMGNARSGAVATRFPVPEAMAVALVDERGVSEYQPIVQGGPSKPVAWPLTTRWHNARKPVRLAFRDDDGLRTGVVELALPRGAPHRLSIELSLRFDTYQRPIVRASADDAGIVWTGTIAGPWARATAGTPLDGDDWRVMLERGVRVAQDWLIRYQPYLRASRMEALDSDLQEARRQVRAGDGVECRRRSDMLSGHLWSSGLASQLFLADQAALHSTPSTDMAFVRLANGARDAWAAGDRASARRLADESTRLLPVGLAEGATLASTGSRRRVARRGTEGERSSRKPVPIPESDAQVDCTVFAPRHARPGTDLLVQALVHGEAETDIVRATAREFDLDAARLGATSFESQPGSQLTLTLQLPGLHIDEPTQTVIWRQRPVGIGFRVRVPHACMSESIIGTVRVRSDQLLIGSVTFKLEISPSSGARPDEAQSSSGLRRYRSAFVSYASRDRSEVLKRLQVLAALRLTFFHDVRDLRPGDPFALVILKEIDECDLFLLFWSDAAKKSKWVSREIGWAVKRKGGDDALPPDICPIAVDDPFPPLPRSLAHLHVG